MFFENVSYIKYKGEVESFIDANLPKYSGDGRKTLCEAMGYAVSGGGKRLRGVLALACGDMLSGETGGALPFAGAIEFIHAYSLVHDDMPCMDDDDFRRGKPSCHKVFGEGTAMLAGDALLNLAFEVLLDYVSATRRGGYKAAEAAAYIARASGAGGMAGGQAIDLGAGAADKDSLIKLCGLKTGRLFNAAVVAPAIFLNAGERDLAALNGYGDALGLAFQIKDDIIDSIDIGSNGGGIDGSVANEGGFDGSVANGGGFDGNVANGGGVGGIVCGGSVSGNAGGGTGIGKSRTEPNFVDAIGLPASMDLLYNVCSEAKKYLERLSDRAGFFYSLIDWLVSEYK